MKKLLIITFILAIGAIGDAKEIFKDNDIRELRVVSIANGRAVIRDMTGTKKEAGVEDHVGKQKCRVIKVEKASITIETETGRTRLPVAHGFEKQ